MVNITNELINDINNKCKNDWKLDISYYIFHKEKTLIKRIKLDEQNYLEFALRYNRQNQVSLHISKFYQEKGDNYASTSGMGKIEILDITQFKRKNINNLISFTNDLDDEKLLEINEKAKTANGYGLIMKSEDF